MSFLCSFEDRVFIPHLTTRQLTMKYPKKSIGYGEMVQLLELLSTYCPCLSNLIHYLVNSNHSYPVDLKARIQCPSEYRELLSSLASSSPVCGLVLPSETNFRLLQKMKEDDLTKDVNMMLALQNEIPVLMKLYQALPSFPHNLLDPIIDQIIIKAKAPFIPVQQNHSSGPKQPEQSIRFFPSLPSIRKRKLYSADKSSRGSICTKKSYGHPSLLPGVFTLFCKHGRRYNYINNTIRIISSQLQVIATDMRLCRQLNPLTSHFPSCMNVLQQVLLPAD